VHIVPADRAQHRIPSPLARATFANHSVNASDGASEPAQSSSWADAGSQSSVPTFAAMYFKQHKQQTSRYSINIYNSTHARYK
jgi:hypothetical protein